MAPDWRSVRWIESSAFDEQAAYLGAIRFRRVTFCVSRIAASCRQVKVQWMATLARDEC